MPFDADVDITCDCQLGNITFSTDGGMLDKEDVLMLWACEPKDTEQQPGSMTRLLQKFVKLHTASLDHIINAETNTLEEKSMVETLRASDETHADLKQKHGVAPKLEELRQDQRHPCAFICHILTISLDFLSGEIPSSTTKHQSTCLGLDLDIEISKGSSGKRLDLQCRAGDLEVNNSEFKRCGTTQGKLEQQLPKNLLINHSMMLYLKEKVDFQLGEYELQALDVHVTHHAPELPHCATTWKHFLEGETITILWNYVRLSAHKCRQPEPVQDATYSGISMSLLGLTDENLEEITALRIAYCPDDVLEVDMADTSQFYLSGETSTSSHVEIPIDETNTVKPLVVPRNQELDTALNWDTITPKACNGMYGQYDSEWKLLDLAAVIYNISFV
ncbi:MAG: hypothetical protein J3Q66DRAFT_398086 [Benniella sp.]|nr:MAG: hypothetical protein J3Q66DRAFT_398086 [Benniella sp.]